MTYCTYPHVYAFRGAFLSDYDPPTWNWYLLFEKSWKMVADPMIINAIEL